jgi:DNA-binding NarL/FixJ family response regulator
MSESLTSARPERLEGRAPAGGDEDAPIPEVLVVDDHLAVRRGVELLLRAEGLRVAGVAERLAQARALLERRRHDVALIDLHLGGASTIGLVEETLARDPDAAIVLYAGSTDADELAAALRAGTRGFVLKSSPASTLIAALRAVAGGGTFIDPDLQSLRARDGERCPASVLSPREHEILCLLGAGLTGRAIARRLFLSPETVRTHVRNAMAKLGAKTRVQAVVMVMRARP